MNRLINKALVVFAAAAMMATLSIESVSAQRPSRGGGGASFSGGRSGSISASRGGGFSHQPTMRGPGRSSYSTSIRSSRSGYNYYRPDYRGGYGRPYSGHRFGFGRPYYRPYYSYYSFYRPFLGVRISVLPYGYYPFWYGPTQFYYSGGLFYQQNNDQYEVVTPPVGAEVPKLPSDANRVTINGVDYYEYKGVYYTQKENADGKTGYIVAGKDGVLNTTEDPADTHNIGDIINQLPEGCREVTIKDEKYFVSPDDVYYEEVVDGTNITYRVIGKLF